MQTETNTVWLRVDGIVCYACVGIIEKLAKSVPGVVNATANYVGEGLELEVEPETDIEAVKKLLEEHGYKAVDTSEKMMLSFDGDTMGALRVRILITFFLSLVLLPYSFLNIPGWVQFIAATIIQIIAGRFFYRDAWYALASGSANMSVLVSIGTLSAYIVSSVSVFFGVGQTFFESSGTVLVLVMMGKYLERSARVSSSDKVRKLLETGPSEAIIIVDGQEQSVPVEEIKKGDVFITPRGGLFPSDGIVIEGHSKADEAALTGESKPADKTIGSRVFATTINMTGRIVAKAECDYDDSVYCSMRKALLQGVNGSKAKIQQIADGVCAKFIPVVLAISVLTLGLWYAFIKPGDFVTAVLHAASVLIIACPCAMGIATPMAMTSAVGALGETGIFVKKQNSIESLARVDAVVFDKTGTLTLPKAQGGERVRAGAQITVETLGKMGVDVWILTGDKKEAAMAVAEEIGCDESHVFYELLPEDKLAKLREIQAGHTVCMIGDGVNDALSLTEADVGVAIGRAAEISVECADMVITQNKITHLLKAIYISRVTLKNIRLSLFWALVYNVVGLALCVAGIITPVYAGAAMSLSSLSVVLNAMSLEKRFKKLTFEKVASVTAVR